MKKLLLISLFPLFGLGSFAQSFVLDTTFQPFFDIRGQSNPIINNIYENDKSDKIFVTGNFRSFHNGAYFDGIVAYDSIGQLKSTFSFGSGFGTGIGTFALFKPNKSHISSGGIGLIIDTLGNQFFSSRAWTVNALRTIRCDEGRPYFFSDGSSLFANSRDNTGNACKIIQGTDTFPGRYIIKLTPQGLWDSTFVSNANSNPDGFLPYDSSRILVYGNPQTFTHYNGVQIDGLCRIFLDGTLDTTFSSPLSPHYFTGVYPISVQPDDGKFFLIGRPYLKGDTFRTPTVRLNANGTVDPTFQYRNGPTYPFNSYYVTIGAVTRTDDRGYLVGGYFSHYQGVQKKSIVKVDSNGVLEPQYFIGAGPDSADPRLFSGFQGLVSVITKSKFGGYYVGGNFLKWDGQASQPIIRITGLNGGIPVGLGTEAPFGSAQGALIEIYPNPTSGIFRVESKIGILSVEVYDLNGRLIQNFVMPRNNRSTNKINLEPFKNGIYFLKFELENGEVLTEKIIKQ